MPILPGIPDPIYTTPVPIRPAIDVVAAVTPNMPMVSAGIMILSAMVLVGIIFFLILTLVLLKIFAAPMDAARSSRMSGEAMIMHFETAKNAVFKLANVQGQGLRHKKVEDGTLAAIPESVNSLGGRPTGIAFSLFGTLLPIKVIAGASVLHQMGIKNLEDVYKAYVETIYTPMIDVATEKPILDKKGNQQLIPHNNLNNISVIKGYDFDNFTNLLEQVNVPCLIPLSIESVMDFTTKNINAHYTEKRINLKFMAWLLDNPDKGMKVLLGTAILAIILIIIGAKVI